MKMFYLYCIFLEVSISVLWLLFSEGKHSEIMCSVFSRKTLGPRFSKFPVYLNR